MSKKRLIIIGGLIFLGLILVVAIFMNLRSNTEPQAVLIKVWGTDSRQVFDQIAGLYRQANPTVTIEYKQIDPEYYESEVVNAMARAEGPDVFMVNNRNFYRSQDKMMPYGGLLPTPSPGQDSFNLVDLRAAFPSVVEQDFVKGGKMYALPLYVDTLAMFYNQDLFDRASIVAPPRNWEDLKKIVPYLRSMNQSNQIVQSAAAIGGSDKTISYPANLVELLMLQNSDSQSSAKDQDAFNFYLQFGNSGSTYYTWNETLGKDYEMFLNNKVAIVFGYHSDKKDLLEKSPYLNLRVAQMPQISSNAKNFADYWGLAVSRQSKIAAPAWDFVIKFTTSYQYAKEYMTATARPPALKSLIEENINDIDKGIFARQALTARAYQITDGRAADLYLGSAINKVVSGQADSKSAFSEAKSKLDLIKIK